jgi:hypothetical protein
MHFNRVKEHSLVYSFLNCDFRMVFQLPRAIPRNGGEWQLCHLARPFSIAVALPVREERTILTILYAFRKGVLDNVM